MLAKATILIVDDSADNIQILASLLNDDYQIKVATSGKCCLELVQQQPQPDLILLDIEMPEMDGFEVCEILKNDKISEDIPIIFVTGNDAEQDEEKGLKLGAVDYITKPIRPSIVAARVKTHITLKQQYDKLQAQATHDQLTGLYNRHYLMQNISKRLSLANRHEQDFSLVMIDIDHFKAINDQYGHPMGDKIIQAVANILIKYSRKEDVAIRYGGEEFILLLEQTNISDAIIIAENYRQKIAQLQPENIALSCSFGVSQLTGNHKNIEILIKAADDALYKAKESGRNKVVSAK
ncbi:MAG: diguanylate cyclase [Pseudomonadota bacterium]